MISDVKNVSGPINIVRIEGQTDGNKKILYLLFDNHITYTKCAEVDSININEYLANTFSNLKTSKFYDFFMETEAPAVIRDTEHNIDFSRRIATFFYKISGVGIHKKKSISDIFKNIRLHTLDSSDYDFFIDIYKKLSYNIGEFKIQQNTNTSITNIFFLRKIIMDIYANDIKNIVMMLSGDSPQFNTIRNKYKHENVKIKMNIELDKIVDHLNMTIRQVLYNIRRTRNNMSMALHIKRCGSIMSKF